MYKSSVTDPDNFAPDPDPGSGCQNWYMILIRRSYYKIIEYCHITIFNNKNLSLRKFWKDFLIILVDVLLFQDPDPDSLKSPGSVTIKKRLAGFMPLTNCLFFWIRNLIRTCVTFNCIIENHIITHFDIVEHSN